MTRTINVTLRNMGKGKPLPDDDPSDRGICEWKAHEDPARCETHYDTGCGKKVSILKIHRVELMICLFCGQAIKEVE